MDIFERELAGEVIDPQTDPEFDKFLAAPLFLYLF